MPEVDLAIIGGGAAGLAAAIAAGEAQAVPMGRGGLRMVVFEGARKPGAKILVSGGGRCNVTHAAVSERDYNGGPPPMIRSVLRAFDLPATLAWFERLGVRLELEPSGKYFPVSDRAQTVLEALLRGVHAAGVRLLAGARVLDLRPAGGEGFDLTVRMAADGSQSVWRARRVIVATGGLALPKSGSDGAGLAWMARLGHTIVPTTPALVALELRPGPGPGGRFAELSGVSFVARLTVRVAGRLVARREGSVLWTHFGISGPAAMDISRHWLRARLEHPADAVELRLNHPAWPTPEAADRWLLDAARREPRRSAAAVLAERLPERWAAVLTEGRDGPLGRWSREQRRALAADLADLRLDVVRDRGYAFAEATAGGVSLRDVDPRTLASRRVPGLHLCGEVLDVDGYIGGFNFQWAWSSGTVAGRAAAAALGGPAPARPAGGENEAGGGW